MYVCSLNKYFDDIDELFKCTNKLFDITAVSETRIIKKIFLTTNINLKNYTMQTLLADFLSEWDCFCWYRLVKGYDLSGNNLNYLRF